MNSSICINCRISMHRLPHNLRPSRQPTISRRAQSTVPATLARASQQQQSHTTPESKTPQTLAPLLSRPTWSVRSLLPGHQAPTSISAKTLHHLLRLSALPLPRNAAEEATMLATLSSQLHFVRAIQGVDTTGVAPLRAIRDETTAGLREQTVGLEELRHALEAEDIVGHARRPRRRRTPRSNAPSKEEGGEELPGRVISQGLDGPVRVDKRIPTNEGDEDWNALGGASETAGGRYFVVRSRGTGSLPNETVG
ncbi:hypothetical protein F4678DRAFT_350907 [Xylaria arbuscula]|nr:hypothetical protein F4678DRAFT_350907 [Xylaria arbuscula]